MKLSTSCVPKQSEQTTLRNLTELPLTASRAAREGETVACGVVCGVLLRPAKAVDLGRLRVHMVVGEGILRACQFPEEAFHLADDSLGHDGWSLVEVQPDDRPTVRNAYRHGIGTHCVCFGLAGSASYKTRPALCCR